jgi:SAM-dependent methyltransferase
MKKNAAPKPVVWTDEKLQQTIMSFQMCRLLLSAAELDLFARMAEGAWTATQLAARTQTTPSALARLLDALCAAGLAVKKNGRYALTKFAASRLAPGRNGLHAWLPHAANMWKMWDTLTAAVRRGRSVALKPVGGRERQWLENFISAMHHRARIQAPDVAKRIPLPPKAKVLDVGGGSGAYSTALVRAGKDVSAVVFDLPRVLPLTRRFLVADGMAGRIKVQAGDYNRDAFRGKYDLVLFSAILHSNSPEQNQAVLRKAYDVLRSGGCVVVSEFILREDRTGPLWPALFALNMLVGTACGNAYTEGEIRSWLKNAGFVALKRVNTSFGADLIMGQKPN